MKTALRWCCGASVVLLAGCASQSNQTTGSLPTPPNAAFTSDIAGVENDTVGAPRGAYLPASTIDFDQVPEPVAVAILRQTDSAQVGKIVRQTRRGQTVYKVELKPQGNGAFQRTFVIAADGTLLKSPRASVPVESDVAPGH